MKSTLLSGSADQALKQKIHTIRGRRVMLDFDLAELYEVPTKALKQAVRRNLNRFPEDFMFILTKEEFVDLRSQLVTSSHGGHRYTPMAFTEHGVLMLSSVLRSDRAIQVNIRIMRVFTRLKEALDEHKELLMKIEEIERQIEGQDEKIKLLFGYIKKLIRRENKPRRKIGFTQSSK